MMAPALPAVADRFNITNDTEVALTLSIFLLTFAIGPLFLGPLSEIYGRQWVRLSYRANFIGFRRTDRSMLDIAHLQHHVLGL